MGFLASHWTWLALGLVLLTLEVMLPGMFLIWVGLAALATGLILWAFQLNFTMTLVMFAVLGLASILIGRRLQKDQKTEQTDAPFLNERGRSLIGKVYLLESAISNGIGSIRIGDSVWRVSGPDLGAGATVKILGIDGSTLLVEAA